jgi:hypothetical protein
LARCLEPDEIRQDYEAGHCEERSDEAIQPSKLVDCFAALAMTTACPVLRKRILP